MKDSTYVILKSFDSNSKTIDTNYIIDNELLLEFGNNNEGLYLLQFKDLQDSTLFYFDFWYEKNNIHLIGDFNKKQNIAIKKSLNNSFLKKYRKLPSKYQKNINKLFQIEENEKKIELSMNKFMDSIKTDQINFLFENSNSDFTIDEFFRHTDKISKDSINLFYNSLNADFKMSKNGVKLKKLLSTDKILIGKKFEDFKAKNLDGEIIKLSNFKGKIILLDFWAYWCKWCHVQNEKEFTYLNENYKEDVVVVSYALDEEKDVWIKSTEKDSYKWVNLSNLEGVKDPIAFQYGVKTLPHSFLIDKKGIVKKEFIGYKKDSLIEKEIKKLLKEN